MYQLSFQVRHSCHYLHISLQVTGDYTSRYSAMTSNDSNKHKVSRTYT
jgi:hypothetical protein